MSSPRHHRHRASQSTLKRGSPGLLLYGKHVVEAAWNNPLRQCTMLYYSHADKIDGFDRARHPQCQHQLISASDLDSMLPQGAPHQGIALRTSPKPQPHFDEWLVASPQASRVVILDQVIDPQNCGAIMRSSLAFHVDAMIVPKHNAPAESAALVKASSGAFEALPMITVTNLKHAFDALKKEGYWLIGIDHHTSNGLAAMPHYPKIALIMGAEGEGIRPSIREALDACYLIPMNPKMESLNVSTAAAIALYHIEMMNK